MTRAADENSAIGNASVSRPWPSKPNRTDHENDGEQASTSEREETYRSIARAFVDNSRDDLEGRIFRALSVSGDTLLRREAVRERRGQAGTYRAKTVAGTMQAFLEWFQQQEDLELDFGEFEQPVGSSFDKDAQFERYGKLCDFERGALEACRRSGDDLYTALLGLTLSHRNANDEYRCPADQWDEQRATWSNHTRQELQRVFDELGVDRYDPDDPPERWWEYVRIAEAHGSGYGHLHGAIVTNVPIDEATLEPVIARHVQNVPSANWAAHQIEANDPEDSCISVRRVDPETDSEGDAVGNLASYLSGYLSEFDEEGEFVEMLERPPAEVMFAATAWATGSRKIDFSNGGHAICRLGYELRPEEYKRTESDAEAPPPQTVRNTATGEEFAILEPGSVERVTVEDQPELDPEKHFVAGTLEATR